MNEPSAQTRPETVLTIEVDGELVTLTGTTKGDEKQRAAITRPWVWGGRARAWVLPRNLRPTTRDYAIRRVRKALQDAGYTVEVNYTGAVQTEAERREAAAQRLEIRADRYEASATRLGAESDARWKAEHALLDPIPFGQPNINGRLTPVLKRAEQHRVAASRAHERAERLAGLAEGVRRQLAGTPQRTLLRRIERLESEIRDIDRRLDGTSGASSRGPATGEYRERLLELRKRAQEALDLDIAERDRRAAEDGVRVWGPADFKKGDHVRGRWGWEEVLRVNPKTLTVRADPGMYDKVDYTSVTGRRRDGEVTQ